VKFNVPSLRCGIEASHEANYIQKLQIKVLIRHECELNECQNYAIRRLNIKYISGQALLYHISKQSIILAPKLIIPLSLQESDFGRESERSVRLFFLVELNHPPPDGIANQILDGKRVLSNRST